MGTVPGPYGLAREGVPPLTAEERLTCPRRMNEFGPWEQKKGLDYWRVDSWTGLRLGGLMNRQWQWPWQPRTCSFCGGVNPDDAVRLLKEGWHVDSTNKLYKRYLEPPGGKLGMEYEGRVFGAGVYVSPWGPVPPVKVYTMHFDGEQITLFNATISEQKT